MNASALTEDGRYLIDVLHFEWKANIARMFVMEHGLRPEFQGGVHIHDHVDPITGVDVRSLFTENRHPNMDKIRDLDAIVFCAQDCGVRHWTFTTHKGYCMKAAKEAGVEFIVVDRPNPIGGHIV